VKGEATNGKEWIEGEHGKKQKMQIIKRRSKRIKKRRQIIEKRRDKRKKEKYR
jgi:hypothetical protein